MAADANLLRSYGDVSAKEDVVLNAIEYLTANETMIQNMLGRTEAINTIHSYLVDTCRTAASAAVAEDADYTDLARTTPTRLTNIVENIAIPFSVTKVQQAVQKYSGENELERQTKKALIEWADALEYDLIHSTLVSGASGTVVKMSGLLEAISTSSNYTAHNSGTVFSASILEGLMKDNWDYSNGDVATDIFVGSYLKNKIDNFTTKSYTVVNGSNNTSIVNMVNVYQTSAGSVRIHAHRLVSLSSDATARVLALRPEKLKIAYLIKPYIDKDLARSGPYDRRVVTGAMTLEVRNQKSNWHATGFKKD